MHSFAIACCSSFVSNKWSIEVEDDGPGTTLSQEQLIKPFVKGSDKMNQGTGLGLSIVQKLIKLNNGELNFQKSSHGGSKVTIILHFQLKKPSYIWDSNRGHH